MKKINAKMMKLDIVYFGEKNHMPPLCPLMIWFFSSRLLYNRSVPIVLSTVYALILIIFENRKAGNY